MGKIDALYGLPVAGTALSLYRLRGYGLDRKFSVVSWELGKWVAPLALYSLYISEPDATKIIGTVLLLLLYVFDAHYQKQTVDRILALEKSEED